jgi:hypothetical protein
MNKETSRVERSTIAVHAQLWGEYEFQRFFLGWQDVAIFCPLLVGCSHNKWINLAMTKDAIGRSF